MIQTLKHYFRQWRRERSNMHHPLELVELLELKPDCLLDNRTLRVIDLHSNQKVYDYFLGVMILNGVPDVHRVCSADIVFGRNSMTHEIVIRYWVEDYPRTFTHKTTITSTRNDTYTMLQLGYGN